MTPKEIFSRMMEDDAYSRWLGVELIWIKEGQCELKATVHSEMLNGFKNAHGGITYALSDSALAFASNSYGIHCVSIETRISHIRPVFEGDELYVKCQEISRTKSLGHYEVKIINQNDKIVSHFTGIVKILDKLWA
jgi:acyl-CoA thioesterase